MDSLSKQDADILDMIINNIDFDRTLEISEERLNRLDKNTYSKEDIEIAEKQSYLIELLFRLFIGFSRS